MKSFSAFRNLTRLAFVGMLAMGAMGAASQALAAAIIIDNFSGTRQAGTRVFTSTQGGGMGTAPTFTEANGGGAIRMQPQNSIVTATLTYTPAATLDLTGGGTNTQFLVEFISVLADNGLPLQGLSNLTITVNTITGPRQKAGLGVFQNQGNMAFPFTQFTGSGNFAQVTSIVLAFSSQTNVSSGWGTITLDRVWASPTAGAVPTPPGAGFTAITATPTGSTTINYALAFSNNQGAAPIIGLTNTDITISGTAGATTLVVTGSGSSYNVAVSGMTTDGTVALTLGANTITDLWQQANPAGATSTTINYVKPPVFTNGPPPASATVGTPYSFTYTASGLGPITYAINSGALPTGLSLSSAGVISGTPTAAGVFSGATRATNVASTNQSFSITAVCPALTVSPTSLPGGAISSAYSTQTLTTSGATGTFTYLVTAGALPAGLSLSSGGVLSGTPTASGPFNFTITTTGPGAGTCTASRAYSLNIAGTFAVTPSAGAGGSIMPNAVVQVAAGQATTFTITPQPGFAASVGGTCGGVLNGATYTTNAINAACTVAASFVALPHLTRVESRKTHGAAGVFPLQIATGVAVTGNVTVEPRVLGAGHTIAFQFDRAITSTGTLSVVDGTLALIAGASAAVAGSEIIVTIPALADNMRARISLTNVSNLGVNATASLGFLVGDMESNQAVGPTDATAVKARSGQVADSNNFRTDVNASGAINASDISAVKARAGKTLP
ncbi:MAG: putative Ig domain-containing protein [Betaproteobacteria bacterium]